MTEQEGVCYGVVSLLYVENEAKVLRLWEELERSPGHTKSIVELAVERAS